MSVHFAEGNYTRDRAVFNLLIEYEQRRYRQGLEGSGEMEYAGTQRARQIVRVLAPSEEYARIWVKDNYSHWGELKIISVDFIELHGAVETSRP